MLFEHTAASQSIRKQSEHIQKQTIHHKRSHCCVCFNFILVVDQKPLISIYGDWIPAGWREREVSAKVRHSDWCHLPTKLTTNSHRFLHIANNEAIKWS